MQSIDNEIRTLLQKGAIQLVDPVSNQFISNIFTRPKKSGGLRTIINLKHLNRYLKKVHFKMEHIMTILPLIKRNMFMTSLDLKDAYFSLPIAKSSRKYLRFLWKGQLYEYQCLCFGLSLAPFYFTKIMKPIFSQLRREGISCTYYIDDSLYLDNSCEKLESHTQRAMTLLKSLGFTINEEKSSVTPATQITHLGFVIDSSTYTISLPSQKIARIENECTQLLTVKRITIRRFSKLIGLFVSSFLAVQHAQLHTRYLEIYKIRYLHKLQSYDRVIYLTQKVRSEIKWWRDNVSTHNGRSISDIIGFNNWQFEIYTDASILGWGATLFQAGKSISQTGGRWLGKEKMRHINFLELRAIQFALFAFQKFISSSSVRIQCDNTTAISYINKFGGCRNGSMNYLSRKIWLWCIDNKISLTAIHMPGIHNTIADKLSRKFIDNVEWSLDAAIFAQLCSISGTPDIDLFASRLNNKLPTYFSWRPDPFCKGVNAFSQSWDYNYGYAFPPFNQISKVLHKLNSHKSCTLLLIFPYWPSQPWFPIISSYFVDFPILLPSVSYLLSCPWDPDTKHPLLPRLTLIACKLSANSYLQKNFQRKLLTSSWPAGGKPLRKIIPPSFDNGFHFVLNGTSTPVYPQLLQF